MWLHQKFHHSQYPSPRVNYSTRQAASDRTASGRRPAAGRAMWTMWAMWPANSDRQQAGQQAGRQAPAAASYTAMDRSTIGPAASGQRPLCVKCNANGSYSSLFGTNPIFCGRIPGRYPIMCRWAYMASSSLNPRLKSPAPAALIMDRCAGCRRRLKNNVSGLHGRAMATFYNFVGHVGHVATRFKSLASHQIYAAVEFL